MEPFVKIAEKFYVAWDLILQEDEKHVKRQSVCTFPRN